VKKATFVIICFAGSILSFNVAATAALIPSIAKEFALSQFLIGKIIWVYMLAYGTFALVYGPLARAIDAKKIVLTCLFLFSIANLLFALSSNIQTLYAARFFMGVFGSALIPLSLILIARHIKSQVRGRSVGLFFSTTFFASLLGLFLSGFVYWRIIYLIPAISGFLLCLVVYFLLPSFRQDASGLEINYLKAFANKKILFIFGYIFCISLFFHGVQQWLGVYFSSKFGLTQFLISMLITLTSFSGIFGEALGGLFSDRLGRLKTINLGIILMIVSVFSLVFKWPLFILAVIMVIWGLGWAFNHAGLSTLLTDLPREFLNEAASLNSSVRFLSGGLGAALGGLLMQKSFTLGFSVFGICLLALLLSTQRLRDTL